MGAFAKSIFEATEAGEMMVHIPGLVLAEILYLSEKKRIEASLRRVADYLERFGGYREVPLDLGVCRSAGEITDIPELHDRLIAGTARLMGLDLITNDPVILASSFVKTVW